MEPVFCMKYRLILIYFFNEKTRECKTKKGYVIYTNITKTGFNMTTQTKQIFNEYTPLINFEETLPKIWSDLSRSIEEKVAKLFPKEHLLVVASNQVQRHRYSVIFKRSDDGSINGYSIQEADKVSKGNPSLEIREWFGTINSECLYHKGIRIVLLEDFNQQEKVVISDLVNRVNLKYQDLLDKYQEKASILNGSMSMGLVQKILNDVKRKRLALSDL